MPSVSLNLINKSPDEVASEMREFGSLNASIPGVPHTLEVESFTQVESPVSNRGLFPTRETVRAIFSNLNKIDKLVLSLPLNREVLGAVTEALEAGKLKGMCLELGNAFWADQADGVPQPYLVTLNAAANSGLRSLEKLNLSPKNLNTVPEAVAKISSLKHVTFNLFQVTKLQIQPLVDMVKNSGSITDLALDSVTLSGPRSGICKSLKSKIAPEILRNRDCSNFEEAFSSKKNAALDSRKGHRLMAEFFGTVLSSKEIPETPGVQDALQGVGRFLNTYDAMNLAKTTRRLFAIAKSSDRLTYAQISRMSALMREGRPQPAQAVGLSVQAVADLDIKPAAKRPKLDQT